MKKVFFCTLCAFSILVYSKFQTAKAGCPPYILCSTASQQDIRTA